uniref:RING-type domain-containing protein n=1 Tax=Meloidogyne incognita TaxID=6306 RepID=A0A914MAR4_MELIC
MELIIEQFPFCGICGENKEASVFKLKGCEDYFHKKCILELLGAQTTLDIEWSHQFGSYISGHKCPVCNSRILINMKKNDALYDTIAAEIRRRQYRHELKMPILQVNTEFERTERIQFIPTNLIQQLPDKKNIIK